MKRFIPAILILVAAIIGLYFGFVRESQSERATRLRNEQDAREVCQQLYHNDDCSK